MPTVQLELDRSLSSAAPNQPGPGPFIRPPSTPHARRIAVSILALAVSAVPGAALAQNESIILQAESGVVGSQFTVATDATVSPAVQYATIQSTVGGQNPGTNDRVITFSVTFPRAGVYELYARVFVVASDPFNNDSFYYANGFGTKIATSDTEWIIANGLASPVGYTLATDKVVGGGPAGSGVWKWVKLSAFDGGEPPVAGFNVPGGALVQTFQIAGREDGLWIDKLAFGPQGTFFTVFQLDNGLPGTTEPPPPPFVPTGPPIATGEPKFLGGVSSPSQVVNFTAYWNQVTPENAGKWGSVEGVRDSMNWNELDGAYALARANGFPFRLHTLIWGNQQPAWIESLPTAEQRQEIEEWFAALAARYPDIDHIDVVNEPLHDPPDGPGDGNYINALGGSGATGWDWVLEAFRLARAHFPHAKLGLNEFSVTNNTADMTRYLDIVRLLQAENLIDTIGVQGHAFSTRPNIPMQTHLANLDLAATTGLPIYVTELDIDGPTDEVQLADYQRIFPVFWNHPAVQGITLWGYRPGHWRTAQGAYIAFANGAERPALRWLKDYAGNTTTAIVRHGPTLNGTIDGYLYVLLPENTTLNSAASVTGDLLVPGTPAVVLNGSATSGGTADGYGSPSPSNHTITLNSASVGRVLRRTDGVALPEIAAPPVPAGTRDVVLDAPGQDPGDFSTLRNLTLNSDVGQVAVPPGTYGHFTANRNAGFTLGVAGATEPAIYNLQGLTLNAASRLEIVGPVILTLATGTTVSGVMGVQGKPEWLSLRFSSGGLTLNRSAVCHARVIAPEGTVRISGTLNGRVIANRLTINSGGVLKAVPIPVP
jgi:endo-1,4-beta-xylanase